MTKCHANTLWLCLSWYEVRFVFVGREKETVRETREEVMGEFGGESERERQRQRAS